MEDKPVLIIDFFGVICCEVFDIWFEKHQLWEKQETISDIMDYGDLGEISLKEECELVGRFSGQTAEEVFLDWKEIVQINQELLEFVRKNREKYRFAILSNSNAEFVRPILEEYKISRLFEKIFLSSDIRKMKPEVETFKLVADIIGVEPKRCTMIDDREVNIEGAKKAGMNGILYRAKMN